ncbi:hypothetical protein ACFWFX_28110 [Streptomyces roseolus]|uniref:hypothetical protein n=1 Tax=Streptomyces roseolus TaxID=67358 RepID=UPI00364F0C7E
MTSHNELRLLPWSGPDGKPCFLSTDDDNSRLSRLADNAEMLQLRRASELLNSVSETLSSGQVVPEELHTLAHYLTESLRDTLRVAESRGHRLPRTAPDLCTHDSAISVPSASFD